MWTLFLRPKETGEALHNARLVEVVQWLARWTSKFQSEGRYQIKSGICRRIASLFHIVSPHPGV